MSREFFREYYESSHAPLALSFFRGFKKYLRNHIVEEVAGEAADFDVFSEFWYETAEELMKTGEFLESDKAPVIRHDENQFMTQQRIVSFAVEEYLIAGEERCIESQVEKLVIAMKRSSAVSAEAFSQQLLTVAGSLAESWRPLRLTCSIVQHNEEEGAWDAFMFVWPGARNTKFELPAELSELFSSAGGRHLVVRTLSFETDLKSVYQNTPAAEGATSE